MGKRVIEVPLDDTQVVLVEVDEEDYYQAGEALAPVASVDEMLSRAGGSVQSAMDKVIVPTVHTILDRLRRVKSPDSVELEFGLKLAGTLGAVFASTQAEGHVTVTMTWNRVEAATAPPDAPQSGQADG